MKLSDGERSATIAPVQEAGRILLDVILRKKHQTHNDPRKGSALSKNEDNHRAFG
jgi:hypothetical protein